MLNSPHVVQYAVDFGLAILALCLLVLLVCEGGDLVRWLIHNRKYHSKHKQ